MTKELGTQWDEHTPTIYVIYIIIRFFGLLFPYSPQIPNILPTSSYPHFPKPIA